MIKKIKTTFKILLFLVVLSAPVLILGEANVSTAALNFFYKPYDQRPSYAGSATGATPASPSVNLNLSGGNNKTTVPSNATGVPPATGTPATSLPTPGNNSPATSDVDFSNTSYKTSNYTPMEAIPGLGKPGDFYDYVAALYRFGVGAIGICAMLMIIIGGYMYMASAGNNASMEKAKNVITDAIVGLLLALSSYLILYVINPYLVKIKRLQPAPTSITTTTPKVGAGTGGGTCTALTSGPCSVENLKSTCLASKADGMAQICAQESGGSTSLESGTDLCMDNNSFSIGLFQINMINSASSAGCNGSAIFSGIGSSSSSYDCYDHKTNSKGVSYCAHRNCKVIDMAKYNECKSKLMNGSANIASACSLSSSRGYGPWSTSAKICGVN